MFKTIFKQFCQHFVENFRFTRICREIVDVAIYALYPESFCGVNLANRKVFAFSDSDGWPSPRGMVVTSIKRSLHMYIVHRQTSEALLCYNF